MDHVRAVSWGKAHLVNAMSQTLQLFYPPSRLLVWIIPSTDGTHARRLVPCIALRAIIKVRVWATWAVTSATRLVGRIRGIRPSAHAYVPRHRDVWATMRLAHHGHYSYLTNLKLIPSHCEIRSSSLRSPFELAAPSTLVARLFCNHQEWR